MITVHLSGGLGNQLFQWAFGLACGRATGQTVQFNSRRCTISSKRAIRRGLRLVELVPNLRLVQTPRWWESLIKRGIVPGLPRWLEQDTLSAPPDFTPPGFAFHASGDFVSEYWFRPALIEVRETLRQARQNWLAGQVADQNMLGALIGVHVRRGDYLGLQQAHPPINAAYLRTALAKMPAGQGLLLCSDDLDWARAALADLDRPIVTLAGNDIDDFFRLSLCQHHVVANSSFSWWAAWIDDDRPNHQVIAPRPWFGPAVDAVRERWICPSRWQRIDRTLD